VLQACCSFFSTSVTFWLESLNIGDFRPISRCFAGQTGEVPGPCYLGGVLFEDLKNKNKNFPHESNLSFCYYFSNC